MTAETKSRDISAARSRSASRLRMLTLLLAALGLIALWLVLPVDAWLRAINTEVQAWGHWAVLVAILIYIAGVPLMVPGAALTLPMGLLFGLWKGFMIVMIGAPVGACIAFLLGRYWVRGWVEERLANRPKFQAIDRAVKQEGWKVVLLMRLSPLVPFNLQNYLFGVTDIAFRPYALASLVGMAPGTLLFVYVGAIGNAASAEQPSALRWTFFGMGLVATALVAAVLARKAKSLMQSQGDAEPSGDLG